MFFSPHLRDEDDTMREQETHGQGEYILVVPPSSPPWEHFHMLLRLVC